MLKVLLRRLLLFIPTLLVISLIAFGLSKLAPGDPVELMLRSASGPVDGDRLGKERVYREISAQLGLNKPVFYFAVSSLAFPDTLYRILNRDHRASLRILIGRYGHWEKVEAYFHALNDLGRALALAPSTLPAEELTAMRVLCQDLYLETGEEHMGQLLQRLKTLAAGQEALNWYAAPPLRALEDAFRRMRTEPERWRLLVPDIKIYGWDNQYHRWIANFLQGKFGISYADGRPVAYVLRDAIRWTLLLNGLAILLVYLLAVPLGVYAGARAGSRFDRGTSLVLFMLYSLPTFWVATLFVIFLTTPEYGLDWFPTTGIGETDPQVSFWTRFTDRLYHLILPVSCLAYGSLAFIARQMRGAMVETLRQDFIRTARAKGLPEKYVIWKHAFRNSLFPIITLFASIFPGILAGSVVIEVIFNLPGMGKLTIQAISMKNWPVVYAVLMLSALLTLVGILVADLLYGLADPRVRAEKESQATSG